ncbi:phosphopantetheinyltransferase component of enterobactin synthase multienzyme complex [Oligella urethralis]|uniref:4'-phosphopantetheinyl transferase family protein n=1 Tax=Oligella urethralis TaxID=90245 RepID=UPI000DFF2428|nr:4'-phosphopantetheinyl transferase superfamily protein [Oligella urethralis]SUA60385.1 phosphopantetheinyltransferase component of enterobactin synthase multienzyme complex [Oligella urethralis]
MTLTDLEEALYRMAKKQNGLALSVLANNPDVLKEWLQRCSVSTKEKIETLSLKRQCSFMLGRLAAYKALRKLNFVSSEQFIFHQLELVKYEDSYRKLWSNGCRGSLSHSQEFVVAMVGLDSVYKGVGVDTEVCLAPEVANQICWDVISKSELEIALSYGLSFEESVTLIFSLKESVFKVLTLEVQKDFHFKNLSLVFLDNGSAVLRMKKTNYADLKLNFYVSWTSFKGSFFTFCLI